MYVCLLAVKLSILQNIRLHYKLYTSIINEEHKGTNKIKIVTEKGDKIEIFYMNVHRRINTFSTD